MVVARAVEGPVTNSVAASFLQQHPHATVYLDEAAAAELTRFKSPWLLGPVRWDKAAIRKAVIWLARQDQGKTAGRPHLRGSWSPAGDPHAGTGGRIMSTALCVLTLEVYYRHLPLYRRDLGGKPMAMK